MLTDTAPFVGIQYCGVGWAMAHPLLTAQRYRYYGNRRVMEEQYATARRWLLLVANQYPDGIVAEGLSDHESLAPTSAPPFVTSLYYQSVQLIWVQSSYRSVRGRIVSNWSRVGGRLCFELVVPANTTATVFVPAQAAAPVTESGKPAGQPEGVHFLRMENHAAVFGVGSGSYRFQSASLLPQKTLKKMLPCARDSIIFIVPFLQTRKR